MRNGLDKAVNFTAQYDMQTHFELTGVALTLDDIRSCIISGSKISLSKDCIDRIQQSRDFLDQAIKTNDKTWYGINTGFGSLYNVSISPNAIERLQLNLIRSHAAGAGPVVPYEISRLVLLLKILSFCPGNSGVRVELVERLITYYNLGLAPVMYQFGSLGASGDLAPLAHLALTVIGEGEFINEDGVLITASKELEAQQLTPLALQAKEGLALINGTQFSAAYAANALLKSEHLYDLANLCAAFSLEAFDANPEPFDARIQQLRPHPGQIHTASEIRRLLDGSEIAMYGEKHLQDPYAFRCIPQVHGASLDVMMHCIQMIEIEMNAVTDNPLIFPETEEVLSGGNFHGQPIALAMDYLALALAELGSISERRTYQLLCGHRGLPDYLTKDPGVQSGYMIAQYTAASIVNRNKILCAPASIDSIPSSKGQEDHVSMSANAASKLYELCDNLNTILSIEFLTAMRALDFRRPARTSPLLEEIRTMYREVVPAQDDDQILQPLIQKTKAFTSARR